MDIVSGLVVFILLWWWVFLMALPFGAKAPESIETGHATSAPERPMILRKALIATLIAGFLFALIYWIIEFNYISLDTL